MALQAVISGGTDLAVAAIGRANAEFRGALAGHHDRVGMMARKLALRLGMNVGAAHRIGQAAARHDTGKYFIRRSILDVPRRLGSSEEAEMRTHTTRGHAALIANNDPALALAARVALEHHEHWDGGGYPYGLRGEAICPEARIVTVCDVYDALREARPYKRAYSHLEAMSVLTRGDDRTRATMFDPAVMAAVLRDGGRFLDMVVDDVAVPELRAA